MQMKPVCKDCPNRFLNCHDVCETYINAKREYEEQKEKLYNSSSYRYEQIERRHNYEKAEKRLKERIRRGGKKFY